MDSETVLVRGAREVSDAGTEKKRSTTLTFVLAAKKKGNEAIVLRPERRRRGGWLSTSPTGRDEAWTLLLLNRSTFTNREPEERSASAIQRLRELAERIGDLTGQREKHVRCSGPPEFHGRTRILKAFRECGFLAALATLWMFAIGYAPQSPQAPTPCPTLRCCNCPQQR
jgi:hypothetical protein